MYINLVTFRRHVLIVISFLLVLLARAPASAHELQVDELSFFPTREGTELILQLTFDPELTRGKDEVLTLELAQARVIQFVRLQLQIYVDGAKCQAQIEVRELYDHTGATSGDNVQLQCPLRWQERHEVFVQLGDKFTPIMVKGPSLTADGRQTQVAELTSPGQSSPKFLFASPGWTQPKSAESPPPVARRAASARSWHQVMFTYLRLGFLHILPWGLDHVLFVVGVVLGARTSGEILLQLTGFTVAHTFSLGLSIVGFYSASPSVVEPLIALSIALLGFENLIKNKTLTRYRVLLVFGFGLVHGLGFATALHAIAPEVGLLIYALLGFNLGVEMGQLAVALPTFLVLLSISRSSSLRAKIVQLASFGLIAIGLYWTVARMLPQQERDELHSAVCARFLLKISVENEKSMCSDRSSATRATG